jgi:hypothetical protein
MDLRILKDLQAKFLDVHIAMDLAGELRQKRSFASLQKRARPSNYLSSDPAFG